MHYHFSRSPLLDTIASDLMLALVVRGAITSARFIQCKLHTIDYMITALFIVFFVAAVFCDKYCLECWGP